MLIVIGHKNPDIDSLVSATVAAELLRRQGKQAMPQRAPGEVNSAAIWLFERVGAKLPTEISNIAGQKVFLVDHTDPAQSPEGIEKAEIVGILDHHFPPAEGCAAAWKIGKEEGFEAEAVGATATLLAEKIDGSWNSKIYAGLLLGAILDDTVIFRSPTTTDRDRGAAEKLAKIAGVEDIEAFGKELFQAKSSFGKMTAEEVLSVDAKEFEFSGKKVFIAVAETVDGGMLLDRQDQFQELLAKKKEEEGFDLAIFGVVDIFKEASWLLLDPEDREPVQAVLPGEVSRKGILPVRGVLSRKKQLQKPLADFFARKK